MNKIIYMFQGLLLLFESCPIKTESRSSKRPRVSVQQGHITNQTKISYPKVSKVFVVVIVIVVSVGDFSNRLAFSGSKTQLSTGFSGLD